MPVPVPRLRVHPNPYIMGCIVATRGDDPKAVPAGRVTYDPQHKHAPNEIGVGARLTEVVEIAAAQSYKVGKKDYPTSPPVHDHRVEYSRVAVEIPNTGYYRDAIKTGVLFAADVKTWVASGGAAAAFVDPAVALAKAKAEAIEHFDASTGEGAHEEMGAHEPLWFGGEAEAPPALAAPEMSTRARSPKQSPTETTSDAKDAGK